MERMPPAINQPRLLGRTLAMEGMEGAVDSVDMLNVSVPGSRQEVKDVFQPGTLDPGAGSDHHSRP